MCALGHLWTAPWQELSDAARPVCAARMAAGHNALRGSGPNCTDCDGVPWKESYNAEKEAAVEGAILSPVVL